MRHLHRSWQNQRPGWTRRIRWYVSNPGGIRLNLEDEDGSVNLYPADAEEARYLMDQFKLGNLKTLEILTMRDL